MAEQTEKPKFDLEKAIAEMLAVPEFTKLKLDVWAKKMGIEASSRDLRAKVIDWLVNYPDQKQAEQLMSKIHFMDFAFISSQVIPRWNEAKKSQPEQSKLTPSQEKLFKLVGATAATGTAIAVSEIVRRLDQLINGGEQVFSANINTAELVQDLEQKLDGKKITIQQSLGGRTGAGDTLTLIDGQDKVLLTITIKNSAENAPLNKTLFSDEEPRKMPKVEVMVSKSNGGNFFEKGVDLYGSGKRAIQQLQTGGSGVVNSILNAADDVGEMIGLVDLPNQVSNVIEKLAEREEQEFDRESDEIATLNNNQLELVLSALLCTSCGVPRPKEASALCAQCGAALANRVEADVGKYGQQLVKFKQMGMVDSDK